MWTSGLIANPLTGAPVALLAESRSLSFPDMDAIDGSLRREAGIALLWLDNVGIAARSVGGATVGELDVVGTWLAGRT